MNLFTFFIARSTNHNIFYCFYIHSDFFIASELARSLEFTVDKLREMFENFADDNIEGYTK